MMIRDSKIKKKNHFGLSKKIPPLRDLQDLLVRPQGRAAEGGAGANSGTGPQAAGARGRHLLPTSPMDQWFFSFSPKMKTYENREFLHDLVGLNYGVHDFHDRLTVGTSTKTGVWATKIWELLMFFSPRKMWNHEKMQIRPNQQKCNLNNNYGDLATKIWTS